MAFNINQRLNGLEPLAYAGANAVQPPDFVTKSRPPTSTDAKNFYLGQIWLDTGTNTPPTSDDVWMLVSLSGGLATWVNFGGGDIETLTGNTGGAVGPDGAANIFVLGDGVYIDIAGNPGTNTLTASLINGGNYAKLFQEDVGTATPLAGQLNILGANGISTFGAGLTVTITAGATIAQSFPTDSGTATPALGVLNILTQNATLGAGSTVLFSAPGPANTVQLNVTNANNTTIIGKSSGNLTLTGANNTVLGSLSAPALTSSPSNTIIGEGSATLLAGGSGLNTIVGQGSATALLTGNNNLILGRTSGNSLTAAESNNVLMNHGGKAAANGWIIVANGAGTRFITTDMVDNQFVGISSGNTTLTGANNTVFGANSLIAATTASTNTIFGNKVMTTATNAGSGNTIMGATSFFIGTGNSNVIVGTFSFASATTASNNVALGNSVAWDSGANLGLLTGTDNILIGYTCASEYRGAESGNIIIESGGGLAVAGESNVCKIDKIRGVTTNVNDAIAVLIDSKGQLGTVSSSARYKENINDMGSRSDVLRKLRPVTFKYKSHPTGSESVGLIAEEVAVVAPNLVVYDKDGVPETVKYHDLVPMLLNEQQQHCRLIAESQAIIADLMNRVKILEEDLIKRNCC